MIMNKPEGGCCDEKTISGAVLRSGGGGGV